MIIKCNDKLFNCDGWREISHEDGYVTVEFFETYTDEDGSKGFCSHVFEIVDDDYYNALYDKYPQFDHKDIRWIKCHACDEAYKVLLQYVQQGKDFIDLDEMNQEELCRECVNDYLREWGEE